MPYRPSAYDFYNHLDWRHRVTNTKGMTPRMSPTASVEYSDSHPQKPRDGALGSNRNVSKLDVNHRVHQHEINARDFSTHKRLFNLLDKRPRHPLSVDGQFSLSKSSSHFLPYDPNHHLGAMDNSYLTNKPSPGVNG